MPAAHAALIGRSFLRFLSVGSQPLRKRGNWLPTPLFVTDGSVFGRLLFSAHAENPAMVGGCFLYERPLTCKPVTDGQFP